MSRNLSSRGHLDSRKNTILIFPYSTQNYKNIFSLTHTLTFIFTWYSTPSYDVLKQLKKVNHDNCGHSVDWVYTDLQLYEQKITFYWIPIGTLGIFLNIGSDNAKNKVDGHQCEVWTAEVQRLYWSLLNSFYIIYRTDIKRFVFFSTKMFHFRKEFWSNDYAG